MRNRAIGPVVEGVRTLFEAGTATGLSDGQLLERYLRRGDDSAEAAFRALVERHGAMVLRACRGVLHDTHAAEDAFQATFLILARKAGSIRKRESVASWLFGVARRVAGRAASQRKHRAAHEGQGVAMAEPVARSSASDRPPGTGSEVQEEVDRLPERYRAPVVLCYLEGLTQEEAAVRLRLPASTVRVRLMRARSRLRDRLIRRGLAPGALAGLAAGRAEAVMPAPLVEETVKAAIRIAVGRAAGASGPVAALVEGVVRAMFLSKLKTAAALLAALTVASLWMIASLAAPEPPPVPPGTEPPATKPPAQQPKAEPPGRGPEVAVAAVKPSRWVRTTSQPGTVEAFDSADLYAKVSGYVTDLKVDIGSRVKKGDLLAEIYAPEILAAVEKARAEVMRAKARVLRARAATQVSQAALETEHAKFKAAATALDDSEITVRYREKQLARLKQLFARGAIEQRLVDEEENRRESALSGSKAARSQLAVAQASEVEARAKVEMAKGDVEEAMADLRVAEAGLDGETALEASMKIHSPYDGIITRRHYHKGELVRPAAGVDPMFTVVMTGLMRVVVLVPDRESPYMDLGDPAKVWINALGPQTVFQGVVSRTAYALDPKDRTLRVEIDLPNPDGRLRPGQYGRAEIQLEARDNVITIPRSAIVDEKADDSAACFRVADGRAVRTGVKMGQQDSARVEVLEGLKEGDVVITTIEPSRPLSDGEPVTIRPEEHGPPGR